MIVGANPLLLKSRIGAIDLDLTTFSEVDPASDVSVSPNTITVTTLSRNVDTYVYEARTISGNFQLDFEFNITAATTSSFWAMAGVNEAIGSSIVASDSITISAFNNAGTLQLRLVEFFSSAVDLDVMGISLSTNYYCRFVRDTAVGTNGTAYLYVASSDANRAAEIWIDTLILALAADLSYPYLYALQSLNSPADGDGMSGTSSNYALTLD